jgi:hypothetical protein
MATALPRAVPSTSKLDRRGRPDGRASPPTPPPGPRLCRAPPLVSPPQPDARRPSPRPPAPPSHTYTPHRQRHAPPTLYRRTRHHTTLQSCEHLASYRQRTLCGSVIALRQDSAFPLVSAAHVHLRTSPSSLLSSCIALARAPCRARTQSLPLTPVPSLHAQPNIHQDHPAPCWLLFSHQSRLRSFPAAGSLSPSELHSSHITSHSLTARGIH